MLASSPLLTDRLTPAGTDSVLMGNKIVKDPENEIIGIKKMLYN